LSKPDKNTKEPKEYLRILAPQAKAAVQAVDPKRNCHIATPAKSPDSASLALELNCNYCSSSAVTNHAKEVQLLACNILAACTDG
jgi:hypothetical protein